MHIFCTSDKNLQSDATQVLKIIQRDFPFGKVRLREKTIA